MSEAIAKSPEANVFVACEAAAGEKWLREAKDGQVRKLFSDFIRKFKHRCLREVRNTRDLKKPSNTGTLVFQFDLLGVPWGDDASPLVKTLQAMVASILAARGTKAESTDERNKTKSLEDRLDAFSKPLPEGKRYAR